MLEFFFHWAKDPQNPFEFNHQFIEVPFELIDMMGFKDYEEKKIIVAFPNTAPDAEALKFLPSIIKNTKKIQLSENKATFELKNVEIHKDQLIFLVKLFDALDIKSLAIGIAKILMKQEKMTFEQIKKLCKDAGWKPQTYIK
jgi:hypothetical protein